MAKWLVPPRWCYDFDNNRTWVSWLPKITEDMFLTWEDLIFPDVVPNEFADHLDLIIRHLEYINEFIRHRSNVGLRRDTNLETVVMMIQAIIDEMNFPLSTQSWRSL